MISEKLSPYSAALKAALELQEAYGHLQNAFLRLEDAGLGTELRYDGITNHMLASVAELEAAQNELETVRRGEQQ